MPHYNLLEMARRANEVERRQLRRDEDRRLLLAMHRQRADNVPMGERVAEAWVQPILRAKGLTPVPLHPLSWEEIAERVRNYAASHELGDVDWLEKTVAYLERLVHPETAPIPPPFTLDPLLIGEE